MTLLQAFISEHGPFHEIDGAGAFLRRLKSSHDHSVAFATGGWRDSARLKLVSSGIEFDDLPLASADDAQRRTDIMQHALRQAGSTFASITYYGDGAWDRDACAALGWRFIPVGAALGGLTSFAQVENS